MVNCCFAAANVIIVEIFCDTSFFSHHIFLSFLFWLSKSKCRSFLKSQFRLCSVAWGGMSMCVCPIRRWSRLCLWGRPCCCPRWESGWSFFTLCCLRARTDGRASPKDRYSEPLEAHEGQVIPFQVLSFSCGVMPLSCPSHCCHLPGAEHQIGPRYWIADSNLETVLIGSIFCVISTSCFLSLLFHVN